MEIPDLIRVLIRMRERLSSGDLAAPEDLVCEL